MTHNCIGPLPNSPDPAVRRTLNWLSALIAAIRFAGGFSNRMGVYFLALHRVLDRLPHGPAVVAQLHAMGVACRRLYESGEVNAALWTAEQMRRKLLRLGWNGPGGSGATAGRITPPKTGGGLAAMRQAV